ncbi:MAG: OprD family outer membrane porin [Spirosomataceae bacterium]
MSTFLQNIKPWLLTVGLLGLANFGKALGLETPKTKKDSTSLSQFFKQGKFHVQIRSYQSATLNQQDLSDYYAWGLGGGIGYETPTFFKHFQVRLSGFFMFNVWSSDLAQADPLTKQLNRYEVGLFDIEHPSDHQDLDRLEELLVRYGFGRKSNLTVGRQMPQTPFINPQDGRMRPTLVEAATAQLNEWKWFKLTAEYIWRISPRSTVRWFDVDQSVGVYPVGVDETGVPSAYKGNLHSKGVGIVGMMYQKAHWDLQVWNTYFQNVNNTTYTKIEWRSTPIARRSWMLGLQALYQQTIGEGGNADVTKAYAQPDTKAVVFSGRLGRLSDRVEWYLNATRITAQGRYLMPREWGREPFYTFLPRERNEGFGDVTAFSVNTFFRPEKHTKIEVSTGYYHLPDVRNYVLNKYGMPSYSQVNVGLTYQFDGFWKGLNAQVLVVRKDNLGETYQNDRYVFNKVNMTHLNIIFNYTY